MIRFEQPELLWLLLLPPLLALWRGSRGKVAAVEFSSTEIARTVARASIRFATLAQAISSTSPTIDIRTMSGVENWVRRSDRPRAPGNTSRCFDVNRWRNAGEGFGID